MKHFVSHHERKDWRLIVENLKELNDRISKKRIALIDSQDRQKRRQMNEIMKLEIRLEQLQRLLNKTS